MMRALNRLRRSVALMIYPDLTADVTFETTRPEGIFDAEAAAKDRTAAHVNLSRESFLSRETHAELVLHLRHRRVERAKEVLKIIQSVQLRGLSGDEDVALDATAERLADLLFGKK
jgi:hypothetical protein